MQCFLSPNRRYKDYVKNVLKLKKMPLQYQNNKECNSMSLIDEPPVYQFQENFPSSPRCLLKPPSIKFYKSIIIGIRRKLNYLLINNLPA